MDSSPEDVISDTDDTISSGQNSVSQNNCHSSNISQSQAISSSYNNLASTIVSSQSSTNSNPISSNNNTTEKHNFSAKIDLDTYDTIPESTRIIMLKSLDPNCPLTSFNPFQSGKDIESMWPC